LPLPALLSSPSPRSSRGEGRGEGCFHKRRVSDSRIGAPPPHLPPLARGGGGGRDQPPPDHRPPPHQPAPAAHLLLAPPPAASPWPGRVRSGRISPRAGTGAPSNSMRSMRT